MVVIDCVYDEATGGCKRCGMHMSRPECSRNCRAGFREHPAEYGVGTELHKILSSLGIGESAGCQCKSRVTLLNQWGPDVCEEKIGQIVEWLAIEARRRGLPFVAVLAKMLVRRAIKKSRASGDQHHGEETQGRTAETQESATEEATSPEVAEPGSLPRRDPA